MLTDVMHGVDMLGNNVMINGNSMQSGNMMQGGAMLPMQMNHSHSRDPQYSPCQITDGSELQADGPAASPTSSLIYSLRGADHDCCVGRRNLRTLLVSPHQ